MSSPLPASKRSQPIIAWYSAIRLLLPLLVFAGLPSAAAEEQRLADYRRVVLAERANDVQQWAADELLRYVGLITGQKLAKVRWSEYTPEAPGLSFFIGGEVAGQV